MVLPSLPQTSCSRPLPCLLRSQCTHCGLGAGTLRCKGRFSQARPCRGPAGADPASSLGVRRRMPGTRTGGNRNALYGSFVSVWGRSEQRQSRCLWEGRTMWGPLTPLVLLALPAPNSPTWLLRRCLTPLPASPLLTQPAPFCQRVGK